MSTYVTTVARPGAKARTSAGARRGIPACPSCTHSGHCTPTAAGVWHSGQIGLPQRWQLTQVSRFGWR